MWSDILKVQYRHRPAHAHGAGLDGIQCPARVRADGADLDAWVGGWKDAIGKNKRSQNATFYFAWAYLARRRARALLLKQTMDMMQDRVQTAMDIMKEKR